MRLWIRKFDLSDTRYNDIHDCFLARALKRKFPKHTPRVGGDRARLSINGKYTHHFEIRNSLKLAQDNTEGFHVTLVPCGPYGMIA